MNIIARIVAHAHVVLVVCASLHAQEPPFEIRGPGIDPSDFRLTEFATGIGYPVGMVELDDGSIAVAVTSSSSFFTNERSGQILRLVDADQDGVADNEGDVLFDGLVGGLSALRRAGNLLVVTGQGGPPITILRVGDSPSAPLTEVGEIRLIYPPGGWLHPHSALAVRQTPGETDRWDIVFQLGSDSNFAVTSRTVRLASDIGLSGEINGDAAHMITIRDTGDAVVGESVVQLATGLRNAAGFAFHPETGDLYLQDNGIDGLQNANEPHSADELNVIAASDIGGDVEDFGFPQSYERYRTEEVIGGDILPLFAFQPLPDPQTGEEGEGPNDIAFAPPLFPEPLRGGVFVTMHGKFSLGGLANEENPLIFADLDSGEYFYFVDTNEPNVGRLDGLLSTENSLFIADISPSGGFGGPADGGVIYQLQSGPSLFPRGVVGERYEAARVDLLETPLAVTLDGATEEEAWERAAFHPLLERWQGGLNGSESASEADFTPSFAAVADAEALYLAWRIIDDVLQDQEEGCRAFHDDSMEIYVDLGNERLADAYDENDAEIIIGARNLQGDGDPNNLTVGIFKRGNCVGDHVINTLTDQQVVRGAVSELPQDAALPGWQGEVAVALQSESAAGQWDVTPEHGVEIGFDVHMTDDDDGGDQGNTSKAQIWSLTDPGSQAWGNPQVFGTLVFTEVGRPTTAPEALFTATPESGVAPLEVCVDASSSRAPAGVEIVDWQWDFAGTPGSGETTCHTFQTAGLFPVTLTVTADNGETAEASLDLAVSCADGDLAAPWQRAVIGNPPFAGGGGMAEGVLSLCGGGNNLSGEADAFSLVYQGVAGDSVFTSQITALEGELGNEVLGVMFRERLDAGARYSTASTRRGLSERYTHFWRAETGETSTFRGRDRTAGPPNNWVRIERQGDEFISSFSADGQEWSEYSRVTLEGFSQDYFAGFFLVSDAPEDGGFEAVTGRFENFALGGSTGPGARFVRGDCDGDGNSCTGVNDALTILNWLFQGSAPPACIAACNSDGVGGVQLTDAVFGLNFCFAGLAPPPPPHPDCGVGDLPDDETLGCETPPAACN